jgi:hypothetical protein
VGKRRTARLEIVHPVGRISPCPRGARQVGGGLGRGELQALGPGFGRGDGRQALGPGFGRGDGRQALGPGFGRGDGRQFMS